MSLSIFPAIFDLIAAAGSRLRVTATLSSSPCKVDTRCAPPITGRVPREVGDRADMGRNRLVLVCRKTGGLLIFLKKMFSNICHHFQLLIMLSKHQQYVQKDQLIHSKSRLSYLSHFTAGIIKKDGGFHRITGC